MSGTASAATLRDLFCTGLYKYKLKPLPHQVAIASPDGGTDGRFHIK